MGFMNSFDAKRAPVGPARDGALSAVLGGAVVFVAEAAGLDLSPEATAGVVVFVMGVATYAVRQIRVLMKHWV